MDKLLSDSAKTEIAKIKIEQDRQTDIPTKI